MESKNIYQTLSNRDNIDEVESQGPYKCNHSEAWLGTGYYFWDTFIDLAHWWGEKGYNSNYIICQAVCNNDSKMIFDLLGNTNHLQECMTYLNLLEKAYNNKEMTVSFVIEHMKKHSGNFHYKAIRAIGVNTINNKNEFDMKRMRFTLRNSAYLDLKPAIQLCIIEKKEIGLRNFRVIFPEHYCQEFTI